MCNLEEFKKDNLENFCKKCVARWLEVYEPREWINHGPYLTIDINKEKEWFFDMGPGEFRTHGDGDMYNVGLAVGYIEFYWFYKFHPEVKPTGFTEENWNKEEFDLMVSDFSRRNELTTLYKDLCKICGVK